NHFLPQHDRTDRFDHSGFFARRVFMRTKLLISAAVSLLISSASTTHGQEDISNRDLEALQGTWLQVSAQGEGKNSAPKENERAKLVFNAQRWSLEFPGLDLRFAGVVKLDAKNDPKIIRLSFTEGPLKGHTGEAIYRLQHDTLIICQIGKGQ